MLEGVLGTVVTVCALLGGLALIGRAMRTGIRAALRAAESASASGLADVSARRGDLTGMNERRIAERRARRLGMRDAALAGLWVGWLILPLTLGWMPEGYAIAAPLWLLPGPRVK